MMIVLITFAAVVIIFLLMALGVIFGRPAIKGSCGGAGECLCTQGKRVVCDKKEERHAA